MIAGRGKSGLNLGSAGRLINGKQGAYCIDRTNLSFMRPEVSTVLRGASLRKRI